MARTSRMMEATLPRREQAEKAVRNARSEQNAEEPLCQPKRPRERQREHRLFMHATILPSPFAADARYRVAQV